MSINTAEMVSKLNMVRTARSFKQKGLIEEYPVLPSSKEEEDEVVRELVHVFLKKKFVGCKIRANALSFSLRLDGQIHRKANKIREIYNNQNEWRQWFESNHSRMYRTMRENRESFRNQTGILERREEGERLFLYVPFGPTRIYGYVNNGLTEFCQWIDNEYQRDVALSAIYEDVLRLMEEEIERREAEKRERIARELREYSTKVTRALFRPIAELQESENAIDRAFAQKFRQWARETGHAPEYAIPATAKELVHPGMKVCVMAPPESQEEGWVSLPPFPGFVEPETLKVQGWGPVTSIDFEGERSRGGQAPIVIKDYMYTEFHLEYWQHLLPADYAEILEVTERLRREAEAEIEPWLEQERIQRAREEEEARIREEAAAYAREQERIAFEEQVRLQVAEQEVREQREAEERMRTLQEQLDRVHAERALPQEPIEVEVVEEEASDEAPEITDAMRRFIDQVRQQAGISSDEIRAASEVPAPEAVQVQVATTEGIYRNSRAIPLESYVAITATGNTRRFRTVEQAAEWMGRTGSFTLEIQDYHAPHSVVQRTQIDL